MNNRDDSRQDDDGGSDPRNLAHAGIDPSRVDSEAAIQLIRVLLIALIESQHIDAERLREVVDDVISAEHGGDPAFHRQVARRVEEVARASYAVIPDRGANDLFPGFGNGGGGDGHG